MTKVNLTKSDWLEIFNALQSKKTSAAVGGDKDWIKHIDAIMRKIGPDGERAIKRGTVSKHDDWWTVVLHVPSSLACKYDQDYYCNSSKGSMINAVESVCSKAIRRFQDPRFSSSDFRVIEIFKGNSVSHLSKWKTQIKNRAE